MPDEREIEKTLREYAKRRREETGEPPPLHPATRNLLQGEAARLGGRRRHRSQSWFQMLFGSGQRIAVSLSTAALVVVVSVAVLINLPRKQNYQMADSRRADEFREKAPGRDAVQPQRPSEPVPAFAANDFLKNKDQDAAKKLEEAPASAVAARQAPASNEMAFALSNNLAQQTARAQSATAPVISVDAAGAVLPSAATLAVAAQPVQPPAKAAEAVTNYYFARNNSTPAPAAIRAFTATNPAVLDSFRVEQSGAEIRIVDGDGSVYTGSMTPATVAEVAQAREETARLAAADKQIQTNSFRVSGTNVTLRQTVEFTGNFVTPPVEADALAPQQPAPAAFGGGGAAGRGGRRGGGGGGGGFGGGGGGGRLPAPTNAAVPATPTPVAAPATLGHTVATPVTRLRIEGRAVVGTNQLEIQAEAVRQ